MIVLIPPRREIQAQRRRARRPRSGRSAAAARPASSRPLVGRPPVDGVEQPVHLEVGQRALVAQRARELQPAVADAGEPADQRDADVGQRVEVERRPLGRADQLERGHPARPGDVVDLVVALVEHAGGVHPPLDVPAAVGPGRPDVLAHGQRDRAARAVDLVGELDAGRRGADHQHAALLELVGVAVAHRRERPDRRRHGLGEPRHAGDVAGPACQHHRPRMPVAPVGARPGSPHRCGAPTSPWCGSAPGPRSRCASGR